VKALVVAGGDVSPRLLRRELWETKFVVCADGGARHMAGTGRMLDLLIGDMDSIDPDLLYSYETEGAEIIRANEEKDETDTQLAMDEAVARGATEIVLLGALGGRIDHTLGNLALLVRAAERNVKAVVKDENCLVFAATGDVELCGCIGDTVSLLPAGSGVSVRYLDGLKYGTQEPLPLPVDSPVGVSNKLTAEKAHVVIEGWAFIIRIITVL
jgi:thiamine pyrophosphokinase